MSEQQQTTGDAGGPSDQMMAYLWTCLAGAVLGTGFYWLQSGSPLLLGWPGFTAIGVVLVVLQRSPRMAAFSGALTAAAVAITGVGWGLGAVLPVFVPEFALVMPVTALVAAYAVLSAQVLGGSLRLVSLALALGVAPLLSALLLGDSTEFMSAVVLATMTAGALWARSGSSSASQAVVDAPMTRSSVGGAESAMSDSDDASTMKQELERLRRVESELNAAKSDAEAANMAKGEFLATMSHEMRTPLNGIIPLLDILRGTRLESDQQEYVNTAYSSAREMLRIVDDVLDYSKIEANKLELESVGLNIRDVVESVSRLMGKVAEKKGIRLEVVIEPQVRIVGRGDPVRMRQVLTNLVSNAIKFTEKGGVTVTVSKRADSRSHQQLLFAVKDTGVGISEDAQKKLFQPFSQADASTTRHFGGTGLGLVICKRIVDLMDGSIGVRSEPGRGSVFWFEIPLLKALGDMTPARTDINGVRALILSGDAQMQQRLKTWLSNWNLQVEISHAPADASNRLKSAASMGTSWAFELFIVDPGPRRAVPVPFMRSVLREPSLDVLQVLSLAATADVPEELAAEQRFAVESREAGEQALKQRIGTLFGLGDSSKPRFSLLAQGGAGMELDAPAATAPAAATEVVRGHVLLVEDNVVNQQVAQRLLGLIGVSFQHAENGRLALNLLASGHFDAILMDCQMPVMDGYTATRARRQMESEASLPRIPIIAMTANAMVGDREKCLASGMDDYLSKPLNRALLEQTLRKWLPADAKSRPGDTAPAQVEPPSAAKQAAAAARAAVSAASAPQPTRGDSPALDMEVVNDLLEVMGAEFADLIRIYLEDTPKNVKLLREAAAANSIQGMVTPAHSLKSTSANLGALRLSDVAKQIEHESRNNSLQNPQLLVQQLEDEFEQAAAALNRLLDSIGS